MSASDWTTVGDGLDAVSVKRGVTAAVPPPTGGGSFCFGFNSTVATAGAVALFTNQADFAPTASGMSVRGAIRRGAGAGPTNYSPMLFGCLASNSVAANAYMIGLEDDDPSHIVIRKGALSGGLPPVALGQQGILMRGTEAFLNDIWVHVRLDIIVNDNGDVILNAFKSTSGDVSAPTWVPVTGAETFVDDVLTVNSGSAPLLAGRMGFAFVTKDVSRRAYVDYLEMIRQI